MQTPSKLSSYLDIEQQESKFKVKRTTKLQEFQPLLQKRRAYQKSMVVQKSNFDTVQLQQSECVHPPLMFSDEHLS